MYLFSVTFFLCVLEYKLRLLAADTYSERRVCWDSAFWRPAQEALGALHSTIKQMQLHYQNRETFTWFEYVEINRAVLYLSLTSCIFHTPPPYLSLRCTLLFCFFLLLPLLLGFSCSTRGILSVLLIL